jgi:hypothetical protein
VNRRRRISAGRAYDDLLPALEGASLVLAGSMMYSARFAAEKLAIPSLTIALQPMVFWSAHDPPSVSQAPSLAPLLLGPATTRAVYGPSKMLAARRARPLRAFRRALGLPDTKASPLFEGQFSPHGTLATYSSLHGGIGTVGQALRAGKPQLIVPFLGDQFDNAARVVRLGVGRWIGQNRYSPNRVAGEIATLLGTHAFKSRAAAVGRDVDLEDGPEVAACVVDSLLSQTTGRA